MMKIKICGIRDDAGLKAAIDGKANFFGMVMAHESPRYIDMALAKYLMSLAGTKIKPVLLLVNPALDEAIDLLKKLDPFALQLHGGESPDFCMALKMQTSQKIIKAIAIEDKDDMVKMVDYEKSVDYFLLDAKPQKNTSRHGGLGKMFDWNLLEDYSVKKPFFLAGGLNVDNIATLIKKITKIDSAYSQFYGVDVSSGVEESLGKKSPIKIKKFCAAIKKNI
ncbi:MAG: phosphoribosylanthranilate isomerase [Alphaproteobacteria bacterium]